MEIQRFWVSAGRDEKNWTILNYGTPNPDGLIDPVGGVSVDHNNDNRPRWTVGDHSKGTGDDLEQAMLAVETLAILEDEGEL